MEKWGKEINNHDINILAILLQKDTKIEMEN